MTPHRNSWQKLLHLLSVMKKNLFNVTVFVARCGLTSAIITNYTVTIKPRVVKAPFLFLLSKFK